MPSFPLQYNRHLQYSTPTNGLVGKNPPLVEQKTARSPPKGETAGELWFFIYMGKYAVSKAPINVIASDVTAPMHIPVGIDFDVPVTLLFLTMSSLPFRCNHISCRDKKEPGQVTVPV